MPIERGQDWGMPGALPVDAPAVVDDAALADAVGRGAAYVRPRGGDLARTLGVTDRTLERDSTMLLPLDLIRVTLDDGAPRLAAAHLVIGSPRRPAAVLMNAAFRGRANLAPRAHPGDGRLDLVRIDLGLVDWIKAVRRMPTGSHVPHPDIAITRVSTWEHDAERPVRVTIDDRPVGRFSRIRCEVLPDAVTVGV